MEPNPANVVAKRAHEPLFGLGVEAEGNDGAIVSTAAFFSAKLYTKTGSVTAAMASVEGNNTFMGGILT